MLWVPCSRGTQAEWRPFLSRPQLVASSRCTQGWPSCLSGTNGGCVRFTRGHIFHWLFPILWPCLLIPFLWEHVLNKLGEQESWLSSVSREPWTKTHQWTFWPFIPLPHQPLGSRSLDRCLPYMSIWMFQRYLKFHMHKNGIQENFPFPSSFGSSCTHSFSCDPTFHLIMPRIQSQTWIFPFHLTQVQSLNESFLWKVSPLLGLSIPTFIALAQGLDRTIVLVSQVALSPPLAHSSRPFPQVTPL